MAQHGVWLNHGDVQRIAGFLRGLRSSVSIEGRAVTDEQKALLRDYVRYFEGPEEGTATLAPWPARESGS